MRAAPLSAPRTGTGLGSDGDATGWQLWVGDGQPARRRNRFASGLGLLGADVVREKFKRTRRCWAGRAELPHRADYSTGFEQPRWEHGLRIWRPNAN